jgi:hypothetical protein
VMHAGPLRFQIPLSAVHGRQQCKCKQCGRQASTAILASHGCQCCCSCNTTTTTTTTSCL